MTRAALAMGFLLLSGGAMAQNQMTQPMPNQNQPLMEQSQSQQPGNARASGPGQVTGQQYNQAIPNQNRPQEQQNNSQGVVRQSR